MRQYIPEVFDLLQKKYRGKIAYTTPFPEEHKLWQDLAEIGGDILFKHTQLLTTERERIEGVIEEHKINIHAIPNDIIQRDESEGYNQALDDIIKAIKQ